MFYGFQGFIQYLWLSKILLSIYTINVQNKHTRKAAQCVVVHVKDDVETVFCTTAVRKPISQQGSAHTAMLRVNKEKLWLSALATSDVRLSHIQLITDAVMGGMELNAKFSSRKKSKTFSHLCYAFLWGVWEQCVAEVMTLPGGPVNPVNYLGSETHSDDWNQCKLCCYMSSSSLKRGNTSSPLFPLFKSEENICVEAFHLTLAASLEPGELLE